MPTSPVENPLDQAALQSEAANVERLRRQIAELPSKGETVTPQLLAQFASAQKKYLDRKIQFEKHRREGGVRSAIPSTPEPSVPTVVPLVKNTHKEPVAPIETVVNEPVTAVEKAPKASIPTSVPVAKVTKPLPIGWLIAAGVVIVGAIVWWMTRK